MSSVDDSTATIDIRGRIEPGDVAAMSGEFTSVKTGQKVVVTCDVIAGDNDPPIDPGADIVIRLADIVQSDDPVAYITVLAENLFANAKKYYEEQGVYGQAEKNYAKELAGDCRYPDVDSDVAAQEEDERQHPMDRRSSKPAFNDVREAFNSLPDAKKKAMVKDYLESIEIPEPERNYRIDQRAREELPDPSKPAGASVNMTKKQANLRLFPDLLKKVDAIAKRTHTPRNRYLEVIIQQHLSLEK